MILNHLERFCQYISQLDFVNTFVLSTWVAFIDSLNHELDISRKKPILTFFCKKNEGCVDKNVNNFFRNISGKADHSIS